VIKKTFKFLSKQNLTDPKPLNGSVLNKNYILTLQWQPERVLRTKTTNITASTSLEYLQQTVLTPSYSDL